VSVGISPGSGMAIVGVSGSVGAGASVAGGGCGLEGEQAARRNSPAVKSRMVFRMVEFYCFL
jgi:hypothetical protein